MARTARSNTPGVTYHLISRFVDRAWFFQSEEERAFYLHLLGRALKDSDWRCLAYALMSNHVHLAMVAGDSPMESWTRRVNSPFAQWMNQRRGRLGPVFASRVTDYGFADRRVAGVIAYIHNNPVRAGVVQRARDSDWTSHRAYVRLVQVPRWLHVAEGMKIVGLVDRNEFDLWVDTTPGERCDLDIELQRRRVRRLGAIELAGPTADGDVTMIPLMARPFAHIRPSPRMLISLVADITRTSEPVICSRRRDRAAASARRVIVSSGLELGLTKSDIAAALGISPQAVHATSRRTVTDLERRTVELVIERMRQATGIRRDVA